MAAHFAMIDQMVVFFLVLVIIVTVITPSEGKRGFSDLREVKILDHLKRLNKPAIKSIKSPDGDIIDCVSITEQPAFDHPLLRNHTIQMRPTFYPKGIFTGKQTLSDVDKHSETITQLWHMSGKCPENTIPIRRTRKEDLLRTNSIENYGKKSQRNISQPKSYGMASVPAYNNHQHAMVYVQNGKFYGANAWINVWKPSVQMKNEFSLSQIWVVGGHYPSDLSTLEAGWQVFPKLYGDNNTRFFIYWTKDTYKRTGCYNLLCSGFVQVNKELVVGGSIKPTSIYSGAQYEIMILIWKEPTTGNWWLKFNDKYVLGYWPSSLFPNLLNGATDIGWGGEIVNERVGGHHTITQMGSGHFAEEGVKKASYFRNIETVDKSLTLRDPKGFKIFTSQSNCYNVKTATSKSWGTYFFYGGPGRNLKCP